MPMPSSHDAAPAAPRSYTPFHPLAWALAALAVLIAWDASGLDLVLARAFGSARGFPLRDHWLFVHVLHEGARRLGWVMVLLLAVGVWWPVGVLRRITQSERLQLAISALLSLGVIALLKQSSTTSCPWDLAEFGGVARYASHWARGAIDGGSGHCFPAGHASAGFAFLGGYFALRRQVPKAARAWLVASLLAGVALGLAQQARGAHFTSHTLWTGWLCWMTGWLCDVAGTALRRRIPEADSGLPADAAVPAPTH